MPIKKNPPRAGEQYAFCLSDPSGRVVRVGEIAWSSGFARLWFLDGQGRRERSLEYRVLDDRLFLLNSREWTYSTPDQPEFDEAAGRTRQSYEPSGRSRLVVEPQGDRGGSTHTQPEVEATSLYRDLPRFPEWAVFAEVPSDVGLLLEDPAPESAEPPWRPATGLSAEGIEAAFVRSGRWKLSEDVVVVTDVVEAGTARMPSGRVIACDPGCMYGDLTPFVTTIPPGDYRVELGIMRFEADPGHVRVTAAKLVVSDTSVASWEPALLAGQDARLLGEDEFYGFGVDAGVGCFFDATALPAFERILDYDTDEEGLIDDVRGTTTAVVPDPESGATLVAYSSGWGDGSYPTWIGRTASGEVACLVSDMLILRGCEPVSEEVPIS